MTLADDFAEDMEQEVLIQIRTGNDGYADTYAEGTITPCIVEREVKNVTKADGTVAVSSLQIHLDGAVVVTAADKITYNGAAIKILAVAPDFDPEAPDEVYSTIIYS